MYQWARRRRATGFLKCIAWRLYGKSARACAGFRTPGGWVDEMPASFFKLIVLNAGRHRLRAGLTVLGMVVAILAFGLLGTVVDAWYAGAEGAHRR